MPASIRPEETRIPRLLAVVGGLILAAAFGMDLLGIGGPGFGVRQMVLVILGLALLLLPAWSKAPPLGAGACLLVGAWFGLVVGFVEVAHRGLFKYGSMFKNIPKDFVWIAPVTYLGVFTMLALLPAILARAGARFVTLPALLVPFTMLALWSQTMLYPLDRLAEVALCAGLGVQTARCAVARAPQLLRWVRRTIPWLAILVPISAGALAVSRCEDRVLSGLPAPRADAPNVLLVVLDTTRADHLQPYGYHRDTTPTMAALAERGVTFDWAFTTSPWTLPSHVSMFTGLYPHEFSADWNRPFDREARTLAEAMSESGYATTGFVANLGYCTWGQGVDEGFSRYEDFVLDYKIATISTNFGKKIAHRFFGDGTHEYMRNSAATITSNFLSWVDQPRERPFFAFLNYFDAHAYYLVPEGYEGRFGTPSPLIRQWYTQQTWPPEEMQGFINAYDACLLSIDDQLGRIVEHLQASGQLDDTIIIVTADHGEQFGEHDLTDHANSLYLPLLHAPLIFSCPARLPAGVRIPDSVSLRDLAATIQDLTGAAPSDRLPGHTLAPLWASDRGSDPIPLSPCLAEVSEGINREPWLPISRGPMKALFEGRLHYIRNGDGVEELYDFGVDPGEENELGATEQGKPVLRRMAEKVDELLRVP